ncbi:MAG: alkaline phosphatase family protein [Candidatus Bathyarchaeia archaeon]
MNEKARILIIGIDGATFDLIKPWVKEGWLPNLAKLIERGVSGKLESTMPPCSIPAWISFATGKNPGKLGVYDLMERRNNGYTVKPWNPSSLKGKTLWDILSDYRVKVGILNFPGTFPPRKVNGFMVTGMLTPSEKKNFTYPESLKSELNHVVGRYELDVDHWMYSDEDRFLRDVYRVTEKRGKAAEYLIQEFGCQFIIVVFTSTDRIQHVMWKHMDATHPQHDPKRAQRYLGVIKAYWRRLDQIVGKLIKGFEDGGTIVVMSDHGFGPRKKTFYVNEWLRQEGFLKLKKSTGKSPLARVAESLYYYLGNIRVYRILTVLLQRLIGRELIYRYAYIFLSYEELINTVDWTQTKAFSCLHTAHLGHIYINLRGREPQGCVELRDYEKLRNEIIRRLSRLRDPWSGEQLKMEIYRSEEIYSGPYVNQAPDIIFMMNDGECEVDTNFGHNSLFKQGSFDLRHTGTHTKRGIFIASGPSIKEGNEITGAKIIDLAPTVLRLFGIPLPKDVDGRVLNEIFSEGSSPAKREATFSGAVEAEEGRRFNVPKEDEKRIVERLRRLGYLN